MPAHPTVAIVGGGIAGLAAAWELCRSAESDRSRVDVRLIESAPRLGGKITTERRDGFVIEAGPDSFLHRKPQAVDLARELGLGERIVGTAPEMRRTWIVRRGRLVELPEGLGPAPCRLAPVFATELLTWRGKLRLAFDLVRPRPRTARSDESLGAFLRRRFGREAFEAFAGPMLAGIYSGDPDTLSLRATFPHYAEIERRHGSLIRGLRAAEQRGRKGAAATGESTRVSLAGGVGELVEALERELTSRTEGAARVELLMGTQVVRLAADRRDPGAGRWSVELSDGSTLAADAVILTVPAYAAADLLDGPAPALSAMLREVRHVSTAAVSLAYDEADLPRPLDGFGFIVPAGEGRRITACSWSSAKLPGRAPAGRALLRVFVGGPGGEERLKLDDEALTTLAREELADLMGLTAAPLLTAVHRHHRGTPQYDVGHGERVAAMEAAAPPGLHLAGSTYHGIGLPDTIASGRRAAKTALASLATPS